MVFFSGVTIEGIGIIAAGVWGTGIGLTSYSENVGAIGITKVRNCYLNTLAHIHGQYAGIALTTRQIANG